MPAKSVAQRRLFAAAAHGATFAKAEKLRESMPKATLREFAVGSEKGKPAHASSYGARLKAKARS